jgi:ferredoxin-thioredoxin reductase catalytic subunit
VKGLASHVETLGRPLCPCRFYPDKEEEVQHGVVRDPVPDKGRPLRGKSAEREIERRERPF